MSFFRKKKKEEKEPPRESRVSVTVLAAQFLDENPGEVDLAWFSAMNSLPFEPPVNKFLTWIRSRGISEVPSFDEARASLLGALKSKIAERRVKGGGL